MTDSPDTTLAAIPGWEGASWSVMTGGLSNRTYRVVKDGQVGVLKIDDVMRSEPLNSRVAEANVQACAAKAGLANAVLYVNDTVYLTEYVDGNAWTRCNLDIDSNLELLAAVLKRLHALPLTGRTFDATTAAKRYVEKIDKLSTDIVDLCTEIVSARRLPQNLCCCHNDLVAANMIATPALIFLDWEYACDNDPFFDLATVVEHHELNEMQVMTLLDAYFDGDGERWRYHLARQQRLYLALLCLWISSRPEVSTSDVQQVANRLVTNCS